MAELIMVAGTIHTAVAGIIHTAVAIANATAIADTNLVADANLVADLAAHDQDLVADQPAVLTCQFAQCY